MLPKLTDARSGPLSFAKPSAAPIKLSSRIGRSPSASNIPRRISGCVSRRSAKARFASFRSRGWTVALAAARTFAPRAKLAPSCCASWIASAGICASNFCAADARLRALVPILKRSRKSRAFSRLLWMRRRPWWRRSARSSRKPTRHAGVWLLNWQRRTDGHCMPRRRPAPTAFAACCAAWNALSEESRTEAQSFTSSGPAIFLAVARKPALGSAGRLPSASSDSSVHAGDLLKRTLADAGGRGGGNAALAQGSLPSKEALEQLVQPSPAS